MNFHSLSEIVPDRGNCLIKVLYSREFSSAKNFVKSDRWAVCQEFIFVKRQSSLVCSSVIRSSLFCLSFIFTFLVPDLCFCKYFSQEFNLVKNCFDERDEIEFLTKISCCTSARNEVDCASMTFSRVCGRNFHRRCGMIPKTESEILLKKINKWGHLCAQRDTSCLNHIWAFFAILKSLYLKKYPHFEVAEKRI